MTLRVLVLEDTYSRINAFKTILGPHVDLTIVENFGQFKKLAICRTYDVMFFDNDLGDGPTGEDASRWFINNQTTLPKLVIAHSANSSAGRRICLNFRDEGVRTFQLEFFGNVRDWFDTLERILNTTLEGVHLELEY
jgi:hypothetical protein